jgi:hypothetical protein
MVGLVGNQPVTFPSRNVRKDRASRLDHAHGHRRLHYELMGNDQYDTGGPFIFGKTAY